MVIYAEFLFIENFIATFLILELTSKLMGCRATLKRKIIGSIVGAISSFIIFLKLTPLLSVVLRVLSGLICIIAAFGYTNLIMVTGVFFLISFASGGMVMALLLWLQESAINHQGIVYIDSFTYFKLLAIGTLAFGFTYWFIKLVRSLDIGSSVTGIVQLVIGDKKYCFRAFVDSGNSLREPISGKSVILIDKKGADKLPFEPSSFEERFCIIPYKAVGVDLGVLEGIRLDRVVYGKRTIEGAYLAFYQGCFDRYEILLNKEFLEGGLLEKVNT